MPEETYDEVGIKAYTHFDYLGTIGRHAFAFVLARDAGGDADDGLGMAITGASTGHSCLSTKQPVGAGIAAASVARYTDVIAYRWSPFVDRVCLCDNKR